MASDQRAFRDNRPGSGDACAEELTLRASRHTRRVTADVWTPEHVVGTGDREMARLAARQRGLVTRVQLRAAGLTRSAVAHRRRTGRLFELHPGVYLVGRASIEPLGRETAAVLLLDGAGVLSHWTAAMLWRLTESVPDEVSITTVGRAVRSRPGLRVHRTRHLPPAEIAVHRGLPLTTPARILFDLAPATPIARLERLLAEARVQRLLAPGDLEAVLDRAPRRAGAARVRQLIEADQDPALTRRELERTFLALVRRAQLPPPLVNSRLLGFEVDFFWPEQRLIVETDGRQFHGHRQAFERDRRRDQILLAAGYRVMRITWRQLTTEPLAVLARLAATLGLAAA